MKKLIYTLVAVLLAVHFYTILKYSSNIPYWDDFDAVLSFFCDFHLEGSFKSKALLLFSQHNEHRIVIDRIVVILDYFLTGKVNFVHLILVGNLLFLLTYFLIVFEATPIFKRLDFSWKWTLALPVFFLMFNLQSWENFMWGMASVQNLGVIFFSFLTFSLLFHSEEINSKRFCVAIVSSACGVFCSGNGLLIPIVSFIFFLLKRRQNTYTVLWGIYSIVIISAYFIGYHSQLGHPSPVKTILYDTDLLLSHFVILLGNGWALVAFDKMISILFGLLALALLACLFTRKGIEKMNLFILASLVFLLVSCALTSITRAGFGTDQALSIRYKIYSCLIFVFLFLGFIDYYKSFSTRLTFKILLIFAMAASLSNYLLALTKNQKSIVEFKKKMSHGLATFSEGNVYFYMAYPDESRAKRILKKSDSLGIYQATLNYSKLESKPVKHQYYRLTNNIDYAFDVRNTGNTIMIDNGWAYIEGHDTRNNTIMVVLKSGSKNLVFDTYSHSRPDVTNSKNNGDLSNSGFSWFLNKDKLEEDIYTVGILIVKRNSLFEETASFELTSTTIQRVKDKISISSVSPIRPVILENSKVRHYLDLFETVNDSLKMRGWALFEGHSSKSLAKNVILKIYPDSIISFSPNLEIRQDVSNGLRGDYDNSGFNLEVPIRNLKGTRFDVILQLEQDGIFKEVILKSNIHMM